MLTRLEPVAFDGGASSFGLSSPRISEKLSIVLPAYNEADCIASSLREISNTIRLHFINFEIIVVDDGSTDGTSVQARAAGSAISEVRVVRYEQNAGKGAALAYGAMFATGDYVAFLDADMDLHPNQIPHFIERMKHSEADAVVGSKYHPLSHVYNYPAIRRAYSLGYYAMVRAFFGLPLRDTQTGLKLFRSELLMDVVPRLLAKRFAFDLELLANAHRLGYALVDAPVRVEFQRAGRINWRDAAKILVDTLAIFYRMHIIRYYDEPRAVSMREGCELGIPSELSGIEEAVAV